MSDVLAAVATAFGVVFLAELGDKTQLLALGFGARHPLRSVIAGLTLGFAVVGALAAVLGGLLGAALPERPLQLAAGVLFLVFAATTLFDRDDECADDAAGAERRFARRSVIATVALSIAIGELGDKTQLTTAALAAQSNPFAVWLGATAGEVSAASIGAIAGQRLGRRIDPRVLRLASAAMFAVFGVILLLSAL